MDNKINELLEEEIESRINELKNLDIASETKSKAIDDISKLHRLRMEEIKVENERQNNLTQNELEKKKFIDEKETKRAQRKERLIEFGLTGANLLVTVGGYVWYNKWHKRNLKFEETGSFCSSQSRNLISSMIPKLKR